MYSHSNCISRFAVTYVPFCTFVSFSQGTFVFS